MSASVTAENVGVQFKMDRQRRPVTPTIARIRFRCSTVWGLRGISFAIEPGSAVALLGRNGSGKTTLLRTLAGVLVPDEGHVEVQGRVASLLSTQAGSMSDLTGRENALLLGVLAGLPRARVQAAFETIRDRSGLGDAFERLVGTYSQGMRARFGFAVIEEVEPEVLLLDEVFEALDGSFRRHVEARARKICDRGGIVIAAGHDYAELGRICDQALVLDEPGVRHISDFDESFTASFAPAVTDRVSE